MEIVVLSGLSGSGKSRAVEAFEDMGYSCIDNFPPSLLSNIPSLIEDNSVSKKTVVVIDSRVKNMITMLIPKIKELKLKGVNIKLLFLDCEKEVLIKRFNETKRMHPLIFDSDDLSLAISSEICMLQDIKKGADIVIDTTTTTSAYLRKRIISLFGERKKTMTINIVSFGFKNGICTEADMVFDVRCLENPFYIQNLKNLTGLEKEVNDFIFSHKESVEYYKKINDTTNYAVELFAKEGKPEITIAIGCTGGHHRSVSFAKKLYDFYTKKGYNTILTNRDIKI